MPGKSRHSKGKHLHHSKKSKAKQRQEAASIRPLATEIPGPATAVEVLLPSKTAAPLAKTRTMQYPYISGELRRIGILAGIIIVILIILAIIIS